MNWYENLPRKQQLALYVLLLLPLMIPIERTKMWPEPMKILLVIENLFAGFLVCYEMLKFLRKNVRKNS